MKFAKSILILSLSTLLLMSFSYQVEKWEFLGKRTVNFAIDKDEIPVTLREGTFSKIKLQVKKAPVHFRKVIVHYRNGSREEIELRDNIPAGGETRVIDLRGNKRIITKVTFFYNTKPRARKRAVVRLFGRN